MILCGKDGARQGRSVRDAKRQCHWALPFRLNTGALWFLVLGVSGLGRFGRALLGAFLRTPAGFLVTQYPSPPGFLGVSVSGRRRAYAPTDAYRAAKYLLARETPVLSRHQEQESGSALMIYSANFVEIVDAGREELVLFLYHKATAFVPRFLIQKTGHPPERDESGGIGPPARKKGV